MVCGELKEVQKELQAVKEQDRRRDREQEEHQRDNARFKEEQTGLQRIRKQLEDELTELRYRHTWRPPDSLLHRNAHLSTSSLSLSVAVSSSLQVSGGVSPPAAPSAAEAAVGVGGGQMSAANTHQHSAAEQRHFTRSV